MSAVVFFLVSQIDSINQFFFDQLYIPSTMLNAKDTSISQGSPERQNQ